jgi:hypothetical protein
VSFDLAEFRLDDFFVDVFAVDDESHSVTIMEREARGARFDNKGWVA